ncbi:MAG: ATP-binding protein [Nitrospinales bacterium]
MKSIILERIEEALHESEELTQAVLDNAFDAIISMDVDGKIRNWNKGAETMFGWLSSQVIGKNLAEIIIPPRYRESHGKGLERFLTTGKAKVLNQQIEIFALHHDGHEFPIEISISATKWANSFIFTGIIRDISQRREAMKQAQQLTEEYEVMHAIAKGLHNSNSIDSMLKVAMQTIVDSKVFNFENRAGVFITEENEQEFFLVSSIGEFSKEFSEIDKQSLIKNGVGRSHQDSEEESVNNICLVDPSQGKRYRGIENKGLYVVPLRGHIGLIGLLVLFASETTPSYERNREILLSIGGLIADAIQHYQCEEKTKKQNEELAAANNKLKELNELKNKFLGIASHDLRSPLYLIRAYSEILKDGLIENINETHQKLAEKIFNSSEFMKTLLENLLDVSKIESGKFVLNKNDENLNSLAKHQVEIHQFISHKKNIEICLDLGEIPLVHCDKNAIIQVMGNFIDNAIKYSPANTKIHVSTAKDGEGIRFSVRDEGPGICTNEQKLLFGEFQTLSTKPTGGEKSTGLGLAIVKKLVTQHEGEVGVFCELGKGSTFFFVLPSHCEVAFSR